MSFGIDPPGLLVGAVVGGLVGLFVWGLERGINGGFHYLWRLFRGSSDQTSKPSDKNET